MLWLLSDGNRNQAAQHTRLGSAATGARSSSPGGWGDIRRDTAGSHGAMHGSRHAVNSSRVRGSAEQLRYAYLGPTQWPGWDWRQARDRWEGRLGARVARHVLVSR